MRDIEIINLTSIGFTKTTAENFFQRLISNNVKRLLDVRLNNRSQLAGFAKGKDLPYFLNRIADIEYSHELLLAPTDELLAFYKKDKGDWETYENRFLDLIYKRKIEDRYSPDFFDNSCLLCSEDKPHFCHRRLVAEYLNEKWSVNINIKHL